MALSEHSLDENLEAAATESETEETPFNCQGHSHLYNSLEHRDYHKRDKDKFYPCDQTICSNWFSGPYHRGTHWGGIPVEHWQETGTVYSEFTSTSFFEGSECCGTSRRAHRESEKGLARNYPVQTGLSEFDTHHLGLKGLEVNYHTD